MYQNYPNIPFQEFMLNCLLNRKVSKFFNVNIYNYTNFMFMYSILCICTLVTHCYYIFNDTKNNI